ncbi:MAG: ABC transporter ATP-binding protein [Ruminococcaceae bacterium]|nr:ABC transporter ATP-binding protein [Oscillospiraceae bacterium]
MKTYIDSVRLKGEIDKESYIAELPAVKFLAEGGKIDISAPVTVFVGENGTGKSTLLEGIAVAFGFNPEGGSRNFDFSTAATHSGLFKHISFAKRAYPKDGFFLRAESFYNVATYIDSIDDGDFIKGYGGVSLHEQSHGESFLSLALNRFRGRGLYILDEPEAALSPQSIMTLIAQMGRLTKEEDSQFIIATHSPMIMAFPGARVYEFSEEGIEEKDYRETEHFQLMKSFMQNPDRMMRYILENEE